MSLKSLLVDGMLGQLIITVVFVIAFCVMLIMQTPIPPFFENILLIIVGYWFGAVTSGYTIRSKSCKCQ